MNRAILPVVANRLTKHIPDGNSQRTILNGVDLSVGENEFVALVGPSGAGKSTLLNILGALDTDYEGNVSVRGVDLASLSDRGRSVVRSRDLGFVFQAYNLLTHMTVLENVTLPAAFDRRAGSNPDHESSPERRGLEVLREVGLEEAASRRPHTLSGGERQRVALARALFSRPALVLCDEPTGNLDRDTAQTVLALFERLLQQGTALLVATHDENLAGRADRVLTLADGNLGERPR